MRFRSGPAIFNPSGLRMPVASMSILPRTGIVHELATPGNFIAASNLAISSGCDMLRGHPSRGFNTTMVSSIESGATSVDVSARPALPRTWATSGRLFRRASVSCTSRLASVIEMAETVEGM
jgi:hypothetical protein